LNGSDLRKGNILLKRLWSEWLRGRGKWIAFFSIAGSYAGFLSRDFVVTDAQTGLSPHAAGRTPGSVVVYEFSFISDRYLYSKKEMSVYILAI
jgi:hypothetical protein